MVTINVPTLNKQFDVLLDKAFNMAFLSLENIRNGELLRPFDCVKSTEDQGAQMLLAQMKMCENELELDALKERKHDYLKDKKTTKRYTEEDI